MKKNMSRFGRGLTLFGMGLVLAGCALFGGKRAATPTVNDPGIVSRISARLAQEPTLQGARVNVQSANGIVELTGSVPSLAEKSRAGIVAASTADVVQVHNDLLVSGGGAR